MKLASKLLFAAFFCTWLAAPVAAADFGFLPQQFGDKFNATAERFAQPFRLGDADCEGESEDLRENCQFKLDTETSLFTQISKDGADRADIIAVVTIVDEKLFPDRVESSANLFSTVVMLLTKDQSFDKVRESIKSIIAQYDPSGPAVTKNLKLGELYFQINLTNAADDDIPVEERGVHIEFAAATDAGNLEAPQE